MRVASENTWSQERMIVKSLIIWMWKELCLYMKYILFNRYDAFWDKLNNKIMWAWLKIDNIISFRAMSCKYVVVICFNFDYSESNQLVVK
jgi:hypothetical protein